MWVARIEVKLPLASRKDAARLQAEGAAAEAGGRVVDVWEEYDHAKLACECERQPKGDYF